MRDANPALFAVCSGCDYNWVGVEKSGEGGLDQRIRWQLSGPCLQQGSGRQGTGNEIFLLLFFFFLPDGKDLKVVEGELTKKKKRVWWNQNGYLFQLNTDIMVNYKHYLILIDQDECIPTVSPKFAFEFWSPYYNGSKSYLRFMQYQWSHGFYCVA